MANKSKEVRQTLIEKGSFTNHSMNQRVLRDMRDGEGKLFPHNRKAGRAIARRERHLKFLEELPRRQFERSLERFLNGGITPEEAMCISRHAGEFGRTIIDDGVEVTIVDFKNNNGVVGPLA